VFAKGDFSIGFFVVVVVVDNLYERSALSGIIVKSSLVGDLSVSLTHECFKYHEFHPQTIFQITTNRL